MIEVSLVGNLRISYSNVVLPRLERLVVFPHGNETAHCISGSVRDEEMDIDEAMQQQGQQEMPARLL